MGYRYSASSTEMTESLARMACAAETSICFGQLAAASTPIYARYIHHLAFLPEAIFLFLHFVRHILPRV